MSYKLTVCIMETLERLIEVYVDELTLFFFSNFNTNCAHGGGDCHHGHHSS